MSNQSWHDLFCPAREETQGRPDGWVLWLAPAKLNLSLRVVGRRADGYHEIDSVVAKVTLYDELTFRRRGDAQIHFDCTGLDCGAEQDNLVFRAAGRLREKGGAFGADIRLTKRIPPGAGLGGGSSDAATALKALNRLWELGLAAAELSELAAELGSDAPLFLDGPAVRIRGRGERVESLSMHPFHALVYLPELGCPTQQVYAAYDALRTRPGRARADQPARPAGPSLWESMLSAGHVAEPPSRWRGEVVNDLAAAAAEVQPGVGEVFERLEAATGQPVHLTGSGSAVFMLLDGERQARQVLESVPQDMKARCRVVLLNSW